MDERVQDLPVVRDAEAPASRTLSVGVGCEHKQYIAAKGAYLAVRRFVPLLYRVRSFHCRMILRRRIESADQVDDLIVGHFLSAIHSVAGVDILFMGCGVLRVIYSGAYMLNFSGFTVFTMARTVCITLSRSYVSLQ